MEVVVPLAGPDFIKPDGSLKALTPIAGQPLLRYVLKARPWAEVVEGYTFILKDGTESRRFAADYLTQWFPRAKNIFLPVFTRGSACSALAGVSCQFNPHTPLIFDLADIHYHTALNIEARFARNPQCGGIALTFTSSSPLYSYLRCDKSGKVVEAAEKKVIATQASAGTYIFRDSSTYLLALAHAFANESDQVYNNLFYICPLFNGVIAQGMEVELECVSDINDIKIRKKE
jgi:hypothetical protein